MKNDKDLQLFLEFPEFQELIKNAPEVPKQANRLRVPQVQRVRRVPVRGF